MAFEVKFELKDSDLDHFRAVMEKAAAGASGLSESEILTKAKELSANLQNDVPEFVVERLRKLEVLVAMVEDSQWQLEGDERSNVLNALAYFSDPEDLVPDHIPALGFLDDAIMIELVVEDLQDDVEAFEEFCAYREREQARSGDKEITTDDWLDAKRRELHSRMRNRRSARRGGGSGFRSIFR
ncbi:MAG: hypothetical protein CL811_01780 [Colwelliaceae bacterium]|nr:hypothetical protein [Colwelliaceae bacterium]